MTISDIAKMAGVSSAAVSRYLNGGSLSSEKREQIRAVIEKTGYHPDLAAQTLRTGHVNQIGVILPKINSESASLVVEGISSALDDSHYLMLLGSTRNREEKEVDYIAAMQRSRVAGIILMGSVLTTAHIRAFADCKVPLVVTGQNFPQVPCVFNDDRNATKELAIRMLEKGRRRIGYIGVPEKDVATGLERRRGVEEALMAAGLSGEMPYACASFGVQDKKSGYECMEQLLFQCPELDGVVCATDSIALGAMTALKKAGRRISEDISIAGVGDNWAGTVIEPALTTVHLYHSQVGMEAAKMLLEILARKDKTVEGPVRHMMLGYSLIERGSI